METIEERRFFGQLGAAGQIAPAWRRLRQAAATWFEESATPWSMAQWVDVEPGLDGVRIRQTTFRSSTLADGFAAAGVRRMLLVAATAGAQVDAEVAHRFATGRPDEAVFLATHAAVVVEALRQRQLDGAGVGLLPHYAPGYAGWDLHDLGPLLDCLPTGIPIACNLDQALRPLRSTVVVAGQPTTGFAIEKHHWSRFGGRTCHEECRPCTCSKT